MHLLNINSFWNKETHFSVGNINHLKSLTSLHNYFKILYDAHYVSDIEFHILNINRLLNNKTHLSILNINNSQSHTSLHNYFEILYDARYFSTFCILLTILSQFYLIVPSVLLKSCNFICNITFHTLNINCSNRMQYSCLCRILITGHNLHNLHNYFQILYDAHSYFCFRTFH